MCVMGGVGVGPLLSQDLYFQIEPKRSKFTLVPILCPLLCTHPSVRPSIGLSYWSACCSSWTKASSPPLDHSLVHACLLSVHLLPSCGPGCRLPREAPARGTLGRWRTHGLPHTQLEGGNHQLLDSRVGLDSRALAAV